MIKLTGFKLSVDNGREFPARRVVLPSPIPPLSGRMKFEPTNDWWGFVASLAAKRQQEDDEDGGMHAVGVQMLVGYEEGQFTVDDILGVVA